MTNEDGSVWVVHNGEISNFRELRTTLERAHHTFVSSTDTEVIVHGYEEWGPDVALRLEGMWGFAIYDQSRRQVLLSRDRTGIKPLYYRASGTSLSFGSELKAFFRAGVRPELELTGLSELLAFGFNPSRSTALRSVKKLLRGENLVYDLQEHSLSVRTYWNGISPGGAESDVDQLPQLLRAAVERDLISDVPVGCYVSGGVDSSLVSIFYSRLYSNALETFTVGFGTDDDESSSGAQIAEVLGARHHPIEVTDHLAAASFASVVPTFDLSITDPATLPLALLASEAKKWVKVVLAGEGGDEVFGGYDYYRALEACRRGRVEGVLRAVPSPLTLAATGYTWLDRSTKLWATIHARSPARGTLALLSSIPLEKAHRMVPGLDVERLVQAMEAEVDCATMTASSNLRLLADQAWLLPESLNYKADKASSSAGLEQRVPLQDRELLEFSNRLDIRAKVGLKFGKIPLRRLLGREAPGLARGGKRGFGTPIRRWICGEISTQVEASVDRLGRLRYVERAEARKVFERSRTGRISDSELSFLWNALVVDQSLQHFGL